MRRAGSVALVGAGPGAADLLTLRALAVLRRATVILVDDLVGDGVLELALRGRRRPPRVVRVGKRGGCASTPQAFIERLMAAEARAGERVVRLKGGDPFVFGRGGEEADALRAQGIAVEVVPGITAGLAAAGALGAPWTHREHAQGVILVTGHAKDGGAGPDWPRLAAAAAGGLTLVIYMAMARLAEVQRALSRELAGSTPAGVVQHAGAPGERRLVTTLAALAADAAEAGFASPAIVIVGDVLRGALEAARRASPAESGDGADKAAGIGLESRSLRVSGHG